jgi:hypothetical protein
MAKISLVEAVATMKLMHEAEIEMVKALWEENFEAAAVHRNKALEYQKYLDDNFVYDGDRKRE